MAFLTSMGGCLPPTSLAIRSPSPCSKRSVMSLSAGWTPASGPAMAVVSPGVRFVFRFVGQRTFITTAELLPDAGSARLFHLLKKTL